MMWYCLARTVKTISSLWCTVGYCNIYLHNYPRFHSISSWISNKSSVHFAHIFWALLGRSRKETAEIVQHVSDRIYLMYNSTKKKKKRNEFKKIKVDLTLGLPVVALWSILQIESLVVTLSTKAASTTVQEITFNKSILKNSTPSNTLNLISASWRTGPQDACTHTFGIQCPTGATARDLTSLLEFHIGYTFLICKSWLHKCWLKWWLGNSKCNHKEWKTGEASWAIQRHSLT